MASTVLVVEDEVKIREMIRRYLEREELAVVTTGSGAEGLTIIERGSVDLVLLDLNLPDVSGETIAAEVAGSVPILMLTAKSSEADRIRGLELGPTTTSRNRSHRDHGRVQRVGSWSRDASGGSGRSE